MGTFPVEILEKVFEYLPLEDKVRCELVCKTWFNILQVFAKNFAFRMKKIRRKKKRVTKHGRMEISTEEAENSSFIDMKCKNVEHAVQYFGKRANVHVKSVIFREIRFKNPKTMFRLLTECFTNLEALVLSCCSYLKPDVPLSTVFYMKTLKRLEITADNRIHISHLNPTSGGFAPLTHLKMRCVGITSDQLVSWCQIFGGKLQYVYFNIEQDMDVDHLIECIESLPVVKNLSFGEKIWSNSEWIAKATQFGLAISSREHLDTLSLILRDCRRFAYYDNDISQDVVELVTNICSNPRLHYLNLSFGTDVKSTIVEAFHVRTPNHSPLMVYAYHTDISHNLYSRRLDGGGEWEVHVQSLPPESLFYGFEADLLQKE